MRLFAFVKAELDAAIAAESKAKDGLEQLIGFYAKDPKQQKQVQGQVRKKKQTKRETRN